MIQALAALFGSAIGGMCVTCNNSADAPPFVGQTETFGVGTRRCFAAQKRVVTALLEAIGSRIFFCRPPRRRLARKPIGIDR
jgi:hypothetical protein